MVRETRHLWVGNLPDDIREEKLKEHFARYGRVESAKLTGKRDADGSQSAFVDFVDINSATKAHDASAITIGERDCQIEYNNPDSPTEIHPGETSREYDLPGRRYDNRRGGNVEDRYDTANSNYEFDRPYGQHYSRENSQYRDESSSSPAYRGERQRDRTRSKNSFYPHSRSTDQYENDNAPNYLKENSYSAADGFGDVPSLRKSRHKTFKGLPGPGQSKSPSGRSGSGSGRKSKSNSRSRSRSRSKSTGSRSSDTGSERGYSQRSRSRESDRDSRNSDETTQSSVGGSSKFAGLCVRNLPARSSDSSIKDGLFHEFKKYGQVTAVTVQDSGKDRKGIVFFKRAEDMEKAMEASRGNSFFGCEMSLSVWDGAGIDVVNSEVKYFEKELDEFHPRATRTLFVGNLDRSVSKEELNEVFHKFGEIVHIEIKKPAGAQPFAFLQFSDIDSVVRARKKLDGEYVGKNKVKLGFGKSMATNCVWLDNLSPLVTDKFLMQFCGLRFGEVSRVVHDRRTNMALVFFINIDDSQKAVQELKNQNVKGRRPKVDFASRECQNHFYDRMEHTGQAQYYNHSRETSPNYSSERKFTKTPSGDYSRGGNYNSSSFEPRRASRSQSSSSFTKYASAGSGGGVGNPPSSYEDRYPTYPRGEEGYHERVPPYKENFPATIRSGSYEDDDYQHALSEYSYHQKERTKELFRERSGSTSPTRQERPSSHLKSLEPVEDDISPVGSEDEDEGCADTPSPKPARKWNSLTVPKSKEGSSIPRSPFSEDQNEPSWKNRNGSSELGSPLDRSEPVRKGKLLPPPDISRDDGSIEHKKTVQNKVSLDKIARDKERLKGGEIHSDLENDTSEGGVERDTWVDKLKDKRSPHSDFITDRASLRPGIDSGGSSLHDGEVVNLESSNEVSPRDDLQRKLEARRQRFSDNSPVDIQKLRKERHFTPGKVPPSKEVGKDSEYIPKSDSFMGDSRTVEDSHSGERNPEAEPPDPGDSNNTPCKHNDKIESFWWIPPNQKSYSADDERPRPSSGDAAEGMSPSREEGAQAALNKPKKSDNTNLGLLCPEDGLAHPQAHKKASPVGSIGQRLERIPHLLLKELEGDISDQEGGEQHEEEVTAKLHSTHSNQGSSGNDNPPSSKLGYPNSRPHPRGNRSEPETTPRGKLFDARQRHPSMGEGDSKLSKVGEEGKGKGYNPKRKGTIIEEMVWKMIPLDPISFPPSGRKEQIDAIYFKTTNNPSLQKEDALVRDLRLKNEAESRAAGGNGNSGGNDQYSNLLTLAELPEGDNFRSDVEQLPLLSPKPGTTRPGNAASPQTSVPPRLSPAGTPGKAKEEMGGIDQLPVKSKASLDPLFKKSSTVTLDVISSLNESSYLRHGENKVTSWLRQMPSPTPVTLENDPRDRTAFLMANKTGSPLSVTPSTPSTPTTPNDAKLVDTLPTKTIVDRLSHCRIVRKNRNSIDVDSRQDSHQKDDLYKYFQLRMKENIIFGSDEARLSTEPKSLTKSQSEDTGVGSGVGLNRSNSDPRMTPAAKLTPSKEGVTSTGQAPNVASSRLQMDSSLSEADGTKADVENSEDIDLEADKTASTETTPAENDTSPSAIIKEPPLRSILKKRTKSTDEVDEVSDPLRKPEGGQESEQGLKRKRSPSPPSGEGEKLFPKSEKISLPTESPEKKADSSTSLPTTPKFPHPTNMLLLTSSNKKKLTVKPKPKVKPEKPSSAAAPTVAAKKTPVEKSTSAKKGSVPKKEAGKTSSESVSMRGKVIGSSSKEKGASKPGSSKKGEKKDDRRVEKSEKKPDEKKQLERKASLEKGEGKKGEKLDDRNVKKMDERSLDKKGEDGKREEKKADKREDKKVSVKTERRTEDRRQDEKKQADAKVDDASKKSMKKLEDKKPVKDAGRGEEKRGTDKKGSEKKSTEKRNEDKRGGDAKKSEDSSKRSEKGGEEVRKSSEQKCDGSKGQDRKTDEKKGEKKTADKSEKTTDDKRGGTDKKGIDKKSEKCRMAEEKKNVEKKVEDKKLMEKKGEKKSLSSLPGKKKSEKVNEKQKETGRTSEKVVQKKVEEKSEVRSHEKSEKSKGKTVNKLQKAESTDSKPKKPTAKDTLKARSKSEDKPRKASQQATKSSSSGQKFTKKTSSAAVNTGKGDLKFGSEGKRGGVRALMDWLEDSDSSESEDEFDNLIFEHPPSSSKSKPSKPPPAPKKNAIFSSSDDSNSDDEPTKPPTRPRQVLQQLYDRVSLSESEDDIPDKVAPAFPPSKLPQRIHSDLTSSSDEEAVVIKRHPPPKKAMSKKRKMPPTKTGKKAKEAPTEAKRMKVGKDIGGPLDSDSSEEEVVAKKPAQEVRKVPSKKPDSKSQTKPRAGKGKSKKEVKETVASGKEVEESVEKIPPSRGKAKKGHRDGEKSAPSKTTASKKKAKTVEKKGLDLLSDSGAEEEEEKAEDVPVVEPPKAPGRKNKKTNSRSKKGRGKQPLSKPTVEKEDISADEADPRMSGSEVVDRAEEGVEDAPSLGNVDPPETAGLDISLDDDHTHEHLQHEEVVEESQVQDLIVQDFETEEIVTEKTVEEVEAPMEKEAAPPPPDPPAKQTKTPKRRRGKHRHNKRVKKEPPPTEPAAVPEIKVSREVDDDEKQDDTIKEKEVEEKQAREEQQRVEETKPEFQAREEEGESTPPLLGECTDAEKEAAMFEETAEATAALVFEETAEATAALEMVEIEQERQRVLEEEIFGESSPLPRSPNLPPTPSPSAPSLQPATPQPEEEPRTPEPPEASNDAEAEETDRKTVVEEPERIGRKGETEGEGDMVKQEEQLPVVAFQGAKLRECDVKIEKMEEPIMEPTIIKEELTEEQPSPIETDLPEITPEVEMKEAESTVTDGVKQEMDQSIIKEEVDSLPTKVEPPLGTIENRQAAKVEEVSEVNVTPAETTLPVPAVNACEDAPDNGDSSVLADTKLEVKLEDLAMPAKLPDSSLELKSDLDDRDVEVTTETASEANDSLVIASEAPELPVPSEAVREKLPEPPPPTPHKSKKKKEHKKKKHKDKKSSKKDATGGRSRDKKQRREKKHHHHKHHKNRGESKEERRKRKQRKAERHRSMSGSSFSDVHGVDQKSLEVLQGQATAASMVPISQPGGLQIQKIENQQAFPYGHPQDPHWFQQMGKGGFYPHQPFPQMERFMKPPMVNPHLGPAPERNISPLQTISPNDIHHQPLRIVGGEEVKLIDPYYYQGMPPTGNPGQVMGLLSPKVRHSSGKDGMGENLEGQQMSGAVAPSATPPRREQPKVELDREGNMIGSLGENDPTPKQSQSGPSQGAEGPKATPVIEGGQGRKNGSGGDVYEFNEEEPSSMAAGGPSENPQKSTSDPYEFQESPGGPASSKASPSRAASRGRLRPRPNRGARTRSNSRGAAKGKEEGVEGGEEAQTKETETVTPRTEVPAVTETKAPVAELVPPTSTESKDVPPKSEESPALSMPLSLPNMGALAGMIPMDALPPQTDKGQMVTCTDHIRMIANVATATTSMADMLRNKASTGGCAIQSQSYMTAPSVSMPAVVAALNNPPGPNAKIQPPQEMRQQGIPLAQQGVPPPKKGSRKRRNDKSMTSMPPYQLPYPPQHPHMQGAIRNNTTQSSVEAVEMHFSESLKRQQMQQQQMQLRMPGQAMMGVQPGMPGPPIGTTSGLVSREAPAITSQLIGAQSFAGNRSPAMAVGMKSGPHTIASVPGSQTSPDTSIPGVSRSGMHPNLPSTLVSGPAPKRQPGVITKYECRVPTSVAAATFPDASVLRARLTQNDPKMRGEDGKMMANQPPPSEVHGPGAFLHPSGYVEKVPGHNEEKGDHHKMGERIVPTEQRLPAAYEPIVYLGPRPGDLQGLRGPVGPLPHGMFPEQGPGMQGLPISSLVQPPYGMPGFPGPFPPRMFHPMVHAEQNQPLASPRAMASPRMIVPNTSSPRLSPKIKSPGLGHGDRTAQTPDKQAELHNVALRHGPAPGITTGIPPSAKDHAHRGMITRDHDLEKASEERRQQMNHLPSHGMPPHIQQLPAQSIPDHARTTPIPHPERGSPGSRTPGPDGRTQVPPNSTGMKQWPAPGITPHATLPAIGGPTTMGDDASVMLLMRYPVMWQGMLALKQEIATIQLHFICGNKVVATDALKMAYPPLRIAQRMRLEDSQLEGVARRMQVAEESVVLLALPCGSDQDEVMSQTSAMRSGLIQYLREKQAAGIINVGPPGCTDPSFVIHIFPPCEFTQRSLSHKAPDLLESVMNLAYMMFVIATC